ncbi:MAG: zinc-binding dehydrogenase [Alphaproteobacteria bacterium]|nr:zinc-binding dehydrogenase [Alphaproteobacteria bacterium]
MSDAVPETMLAVTAETSGGPEVLKVTPQPTPEPAEGEVLIRVEAAALNWGDILERRGDYPGWAPRPTSIMGLEAAGTVAKVGPGVNRYNVGDAVCALLAGGGYAQYVAVPSPQVLPLPRGLSMAEGAAIPEAFCTVWTNLIERGHLRPSDTVLIHGGASGIGTTAILVAKGLGARVFATAGTDEKCARCEEIGADKAINYKTTDFVEAVRGLTDGAGVDVVLDMVGGDYIQKDLDLLKTDGRLVSVGMLGGNQVTFNLSSVLLKRLTIAGSTLRSRSVAEKGALMAELKRCIWPMFEYQGMKPVVDSVIPFEQAGEAHARMEQRLHTGKIILGVSH